MKLYDKNGKEINLVDFDKVTFVENSTNNIRYLFGMVDITKYGSDVYKAIPKFIESLSPKELTVIDIVVSYGGPYHFRGYLYTGGRYGSFDFDTYDGVHIKKYDLSNGQWSTYRLTLSPKTN